MGKSKETYGKKEVRNKKAKKRLEKDKKRLERKESGTRSSFDDMIAWVDENGNISSTPPDPAKKTLIDVESINISVPKAEFRENRSEKIRKGKITDFDINKGYGFVSDKETREMVFLHISDCLEQLKAGDIIEFEVERGIKGLKARQAKLVKD